MDVLAPETLKLFFTLFFFFFFFGSYVIFVFSKSAKYLLHIFRIDVK